MHLLHNRLKWYICHRFKKNYLNCIYCLTNHLTWPIWPMSNNWHKHTHYFLDCHFIDSDFFWFANRLTDRLTVFKMSITLYFYNHFVFLVLYNCIFTFHQIYERLFLPTNRFDSAMRPCKRQGGVYSTYAWIYTQIRKIKC